jgi:hypothetical protein
VPTGRVQVKEDVISVTRTEVLKNLNLVVPNAVWLNKSQIKHYLHIGDTSVDKLTADLEFVPLGGRDKRFLLTDIADAIARRTQM